MSSESIFDPLPESLGKDFARLAGNGEVPDYACRTDLHADGQFGESWVAVNRHRVVSFDRDREPLHLPLSEITEIKVDELFSASRLIATTADGDQTLAVYSRRRVPEFAILCRAIDDLRAGRVPELPDSFEHALCAKCSAPLPERGVTCPLCLSQRHIALRLARILAPYRWRTFLLVLASGAGVGATMIPPQTFRMITDRVIIGGKHGELLFWIGLMLVAFLADGVFRYLTNWTNAWLAARVVADMRSRLHAKAQRLQMRYHNRHESGQLIGRIMHDTGELQHFLTDGLPFFLVNILQSITIAIILVRMNWRLTLLVCLPVPLLIVGGRIFWSILRPMFYKHGNRIGSLHTILGESLNGVRAVKSMAQEDRRALMFDGANEQLFGVGVRVSRTFSAFFSTMGLSMSAGMVLVWYFGGRFLISDSPDMQLGTLVAFAAYMAMFYGPLQWFAAIFNWVGAALTAGERIFAVLDQPTERYHPEGAVQPDPLLGEIRFHDVRFSYDRGKEVIKGIDLTVPAGRMVGLVGKSGAGKSTMINLVCRFYDPDSGAITVDGHDLRSLDLEAWRRNVGIVMQDPFLFNASILENIRYGRPNAPLDDVVDAARRAQAHAFICLKEDGYDTVIGDGGASLSGGEKQRIAIARAILHDPPVLILDEATSAVDSETEKLIQVAIGNLVRDRTTIAIAHRLATLRNADFLVVIEDGKIVEQGTHEELMALEDGHFARLVMLQTEINQLRAEQSIWQE